MENLYKFASMPQERSRLVNFHKEYNKNTAPIGAVFLLSGGVVSVGGNY